MIQRVSLDTFPLGKSYGGAGNSSQRVPFYRILIDDSPEDCVRSSAYGKPNEMALSNKFRNANGSAGFLMPFVYLHNALRTGARDNEGKAVVYGLDSNGYRMMAAFLMSNILPGARATDYAVRTLLEKSLPEEVIKEIYESDERKKRIVRRAEFLEQRAVIGVEDIPEKARKFLHQTKYTAINARQELLVYFPNPLFFKENIATNPLSRESLENIVSTPLAPA